MTNQQKLEAVIAQAQKRGWMEGWKFSHFKINTGKDIIDMYFLRVDKNIYYLFSINDILFGTDFCEKFFDAHGSFVDGIECKKCFDTHQTILVTHQSVMLSMTESERIDFLYKHVENEENIELFKDIEKEIHEELMKSKKPQPVELKHSEKECRGDHPVLHKVPVGFMGFHFEDYKDL